MSTSKQLDNIYTKGTSLGGVVEDHYLSHHGNTTESTPRPLNSISIEGTSLRGVDGCRYLFHDGEKLASIPKQQMLNVVSCSIMEGRLKAIYSKRTSFSGLVPPSWKTGVHTEGLVPGCRCLSTLKQLNTTYAEGTFLGKNVEFCYLFHHGRNSVFTPKQLNTICTKHTSLGGVTKYR